MKRWHVLSGTALVLSMCGTPALAQLQPGSDPSHQATASSVDSASDSGLDDIIVTGTRIRRPNAVSTSPITTVDQQELQFQGVFNVEEALNRLPQVRSDQTQFVNASDTNGQAKVNLRNLGWERTLVLLDGQRLGPAEGIDLNMIPAALVQRIDVLTGGASATYGSDAVAGVVNFVLNRRFQGITLDSAYGFYDHTNDNQLVRSAIASYPNISLPSKHSRDGGHYNFNVTAGTDFLDGKGHISVFGGYLNQNPVQWKDRDYSACRITTNGSNATCAVNTLYSEYGSFIPADGPNAGTQFHLPKDGSPNFVIGNGPYAFNTRTNFNFLRKDRRYTAGAFLNYDFSSAFGLYGTFMYLRDRTESSFYHALNYDTVSIGCDNPFLSASQASTLCGAAAGSATKTSLDIAYMFNNPGRPFLTNRATNKSFRFTGGARGGFDDNAWHYDINYVYARVRNSLSDNNEIADPRLIEAVDAVSVNGKPTCRSVVDGTDPSCVPANIFSYHAIDPAFFNWASVNYSWYRVTTLKDVNANITGNLDKYGIKSPWAAQGVSVALGAEYRYNSLYNVASPETIAFVGFPNNNRGRFDAKEVYGEVQLPLISDKPLIEALTVDGAYRLSKYQNQGKVLPTSKIELQYRPVRDLLLRGSYNKAAHAPNITQLYTTPNLNATMGGGDACAGATPTASLAQCASTGVTAAQYGHIPDCPNGDCRVVSLDGNPALKPEEARTYTFGFVYTPHQLRTLTLSVDYYNIKIKDYLNYVSASDFFNQCLNTGLDYYCRAVHRDPGNGSLFGRLNTGGYVQGGWFNTDFVDTKGIDFQANYHSSPAGWGQISADFVGTYLIAIGGRNSPVEQVFNTAGYFGAPSAYAVQPRWRHNMRLTWETPWSHAVLSVNWRYIGGSSLGANSSDPLINRGATPYTIFTKLPAYNYIDLSGSVKLFKRATLRLSIDNLFDKTPPIMPSTFVDGTTNNPNTYTGTYDTLGRSVVVGLNVKI